MKTTLVYTGARRVSGGLVYTYTPIDDVGQLSERAWFYNEPLTDHRTGSVLEFECNGVDRADVRSDTVKYQCAWHDTDMVLTWDAEHIGTTEAYRAEENDPPMRMVEALRPFRSAYAEMGHTERAMLIGQIVRCIVGGA